MSSRNHVIALVVLVVLGAGIWWALSAESDGSHTLSNSGPSVEIKSPASSIPPPPVPIEDDSSRTPAVEPPKRNGMLPTSVTWPPVAHAFVEKEDPDPALSSELESTIQRHLVFLDASRFEAQSVQCRGKACQILFIDRMPREGEPETSILKPMFVELRKATIRNPTTGAQIASPKLIVVARPPEAGETVGMAVVIEFQ